jgi:hypothetical protein
VRPWPHPVLFARQDGRGLHGGPGEVPGFHRVTAPLAARHWLVSGTSLCAGELPA